IYSLGCTFYYLLAGQPPFPGTSLMQKILQHQQEEPPPIHTVRTDVPDEVAAILQKMLAKQPEARYQIPLAVSVPLRRFCQAGSFTGRAQRPGPNGPTARSPGSSGVRPTVGSLGTLRRKP